MSRNHNPDLLAPQDENEGDEAEEEKGGYEDDDEDEDEDEEDDEDNYSAPMFDQVTRREIIAVRGESYVWRLPKY
jgi:hypothetical protein